MKVWRPKLRRELDGRVCDIHVAAGYACSLLFRVVSELVSYPQYSDSFPRGRSMTGRIVVLRHTCLLRGSFDEAESHQRPVKLFQRTVPPLFLMCRSISVLEARIPALIYESKCQPPRLLGRTGRTMSYKCEPHTECVMEY